MKMFTLAEIFCYILLTVDFIYIMVKLYKMK